MSSSRLPGAGRRRRTPTSSTTTRSRRAGTSPPGSSRNCTPRSSATGSDRCADRLLRAARTNTVRAARGLFADRPALSPAAACAGSTPRKARLRERALAGKPGGQLALGQEAPQHVLQDPAVAEVLALLRRLEPDADAELLLVCGDRRLGGLAVLEAGDRE